MMDSTRLILAVAMVIGQPFSSQNSYAHTGPSRSWGEAEAAEAVDAPLSAKECEVWAAFGRSVLGWGEPPGDARHFMIFYRPSKNGYVEQCSWETLGISPPPKSEPNPNNVEYFGTPLFQRDGQSVEVEKTVRINNGMHGLFMQVELCKLRRTKGGWKLKRCRVEDIS